MTERTEQALSKPALESVAAYVPTRGHQPTALGLGSSWDMEATATHTVLCGQCLKTYLFSSGSETVRAAMKNEAQLRNEPDNRCVFSGQPVFDTATGLLQVFPLVGATTQGAAPGR